jgi:hypothetical protein
MTLLEIGADCQALQALIEDLEDGILTPDAEAALDQWFAELGKARDAKLDGYAALIRSLELRAAVRKEERDRLTKRIDVDTNAAGRLKARLKEFFELQGLTKVETDRYRLSLVKNGGKVPLQMDVEPEQLPARLTRVRVEPDTEAIRAELEAGQAVPGCRLLPRATHMRIA